MHTTYLIYGIMFIVGLCAGSFLNVVVHRVPRGESVVSPPSRCPACERRLGPLELLPLLGYLFLRGRCRGCGLPISLRYPLVELAAGLIMVAVYRQFGFSLEGAGYLFLLYLLLTVALIDLSHRRVPNRLVIVGLGAGLVLLLISLTGLPWAGWTGWSDALMGLALAGGVMFLIYLAGRGGMGAGDVKLAALIGLFLGLKGAVLVLLLGFVLGAVTGVLLMILGRLRRREPLPFAPFLSLAALADIFWGASIWQWYLSFSGWW